MEQRPLDLIRDGDRIVGVKLLTDMDYEQAFKELAVTLLRKEAIRLWRLAWEHDGESRNSKLDAFQKCAKVRAAQDAWETVTILEAKIAKFVETGEWEDEPCAE